MRIRMVLKDTPMDIWYNTVIIVAIIYSCEDIGYNRILPRRSACEKGRRALKRCVIILAALGIGPLALWAAEPFEPDRANIIEFEPVEARFVRFVMPGNQPSSPCIDELEFYGPGSDTNLALARTGAKATASSCLPGYAIHQIAHLNDGLYGNSHSWIAGGPRNEWAQIELPAVVSLARVVFSRDREGRHRDRVPTSIEIRVSVDGTDWRTVARRNARSLLRPRAGCV